MPCQHLGSREADSSEVAHVGHDGGEHVVARSRRDLITHANGLGLVAAEQDDGGTALCQQFGGDQPETGGGAGDQHHATLQAVLVERGPMRRTRAGVVPDARETGEHGGLQHRIDHALHAHRGTSCPSSTPEAGSGTITDAAEGETQHRIGDAQHPVELEQRAVGDQGGVAVGGDGDPIGRGERAALGDHHQFGGRLVDLGDVTQRGAGDGDIELGAGTCTVALDLHDLLHAGIPLGEVTQVGHVGEGLRSRLLRANGGDVTRHVDLRLSGERAVYGR